MNRIGQLACLICAFSLQLYDIESLLAQENILGIPESHDPRRLGAIVLHGGGPISNDVFRRFVELAGGPHAKIVFVPCAGFRRGWYESDKEMINALSFRYSAWVSLATNRQIERFQFLFTDEPDDANNIDFCEYVFGFWLGSVFVFKQ